MKTIIGNKEFEVQKKGNRFYYWSIKAMRNIQIAKSKVIFE